MQRSIFDQKPLRYLFYIAFFVLYTSLSSIYLFLPPLLAVLFVLFVNALKEQNSIEIFLISLCLILYESQVNFPLFSTIIYFSLLYKFVLPKLNQSINCKSCVKFLVVILVYIGFFIFDLLMSNIFLTDTPSINYYVIYYIIIEFFIVSIL